MNSRPLMYALPLALAVLLLWSAFPLASAKLYERYEQQDSPSGPTTTAWRGQTFLIGTTGANESFVLTNISLYMDTVADGNLTILVQTTNATGFPTGNNVSIGSILASRIGAANWYNVTMSRSNLSQGVRYALVAFTNVSAGASIRPYIQSTGATYTGGNGTASATAGTTFTLEDYDHAFRVYGDALNTTVDLLLPANMTSTPSTPLKFNGTITPAAAQSLVNATVYIFNASGAIYTRNTTSLSGTSPRSVEWVLNTFTAQDYKWNILGCSTNNCMWALSNYTFTIGATNYSQQYNATSYETSLEHFTTNFSLPATTNISSAIFVWEGTAYTATVTHIVGNNYSLTRSLDVPLTSGTKNWYWSINFTNGFQQTYGNNTQSILGTLLTICNATQNVTYINFTFKDETTLVDKNASVDSSTWYYYLGSGAVNKTLTFSNSTGHPSYAFCYTPSGRTLTVDLDFFKYSGSGYPLRTYAPSLLTLSNSTTNQVLYLLSSTEGIYSSFQAVDSTTLQPISGVFVSISRTIGSTTVVIEQGLTDDSGLITFWVNPNFDHTIQASKTGYTTRTVTVRPSQSTYTLTLAQTGATNASYSSPIPGIKWIIFPALGSVDIGSRKWGFNLTSESGILEDCKFELVHAANGTIVASNTGASAYSCNVSVTYAPGRGDVFFGRISVDTTETSGFVIVDADTKWLLYDLNVTNWTTFGSFLTDLKDYSELGSDQNRREFSRFIVFFFLGTILLAILTHTTQWEVNSPGTALVIVWCITAIASFSGFLQFDLGSEFTNERIEKYGILIVYTLFVGGYILNQIRRQSD